MSTIWKSLLVSPRNTTTTVRVITVLIILTSVAWWVKVASFLPGSYVPTSALGNVPPAPAQESIPSSALVDGLHVPTIGTSKAAHPIESLIQEAEREVDDLLKKQTRDVRAAAVEYRKRRGRHPPPGFQAWFDFAQEREAIIIEEFFDQIYHDLSPFWGLDPHHLKHQAKFFEKTIKVRERNATSSHHAVWTDIWLDMIQSIAPHLPDMDIPVNTMDEPRLTVPWEIINELIEKEHASRRLPPASKMKETYRGLQDIDKETGSDTIEWEGGYNPPFFERARVGCHPGSLARKAVVVDDWSHRPTLSTRYAEPHLLDGYVKNFTLSSDICHQPDLQTLHGAFIEAQSVKISHELIPLFGGSKLSTNNEILLPPAMYWSDDELYSGGQYHGNPWAEKANSVIWRGAGTGGRNTPTNWKGFQRHRFVSMTNGTQVNMAEDWRVLPMNFNPPPPIYELRASRNKRLGEWLESFTDVGLVSLDCFPANENPADKGCRYTNEYFAVTKGVKMGEQFERKYLPDIDGNSFSGRYWAFLRSTSLPIKATIFREWHDSRLIAWKHFVPMDNRFLDFYGIMEYFHGYDLETEDPVYGHDVEAEKIATAGQEWANKVLRKEDMQIYVMRLLMEFARILDEDRDNLGWVGDII